MTGTKVPSREQLDSLLDSYQSGRYSEAEKLAESITQDFPYYQIAWKVLGAVLRATGRKSEAMKANQTAVTLSPQDAAAHNNLGITLKELGRLDEALASYTQAIALKPDYAEAHSNLGMTLQELGRLEESELSFRKAIDLQPDYSEAYQNLGIALSSIKPRMFSKSLAESYLNILDFATIVSPAMIVGRVIALLKHHDTIKEVINFKAQNTLKNSTSEFCIRLSKILLLMC